MSESTLQSKCFLWAHNTFPELRGLLFSVPNGGTRNIREAMTLKATGLIAGIPDMLCVYRGLTAFEFKTPTGVLSPAQKKIHEKWRSAGIPVHVVRTEEQFKDLIFGIINGF